MWKAAKLLVAAAIAGGVIGILDDSRLPWNVEPGRTLAADVVGTMLPEAVGFSGTLSGEVANPGGQGWFVIKVVKVVSLARNNRTRLKAAALTAAWKDKYVTIVGKNMPPVALGDAVTVVGVQFEMHIRASKVTKHDAAQSDGSSAASLPRTSQSPEAESTALRSPRSSARRWTVAG